MIKLVLPVFESSCKYVAVMTVIANNNNNNNNIIYIALYTKVLKRVTMEEENRIIKLFSRDDLKALTLHIIKRLSR